ncbi:MAG: hydantoinase/oxoprolinase family protein [Acidobacteriaceae bacterium]
MIRIGIDTGGTFTDFVRLDDDRLSVHKVRSTPADPSLAILSGLAEMAAGQAVSEVVHGTTVATNAVLECKVARVALVTTKGFEDVLLIGRQARSELYNFMIPLPRPILEPGLTFGVHERLDQHGNVVEPIDSAEIDALAMALQTVQAECVAVCLLHSYANPAHEQEIAERLARAGFTVSTSHSVLPEYREYERWSTTVVSAAITPLMSRYLTALEVGLAGTPLRIMQSNGGSISAREARRSAVRTILSGPAAGAVGAHALGRASGFDQMILFDMGGTSTDVSLIDGRLGTTSESVVGDFPVRIPMLDIHTVGAGGGSIARLDAGGALRVGPQSAGARPGPVCYGEGNDLTVTDANLLLGRLDPEHFLGGRMSLDLPRVVERANAFAARLGISAMRLAEGIVAIANANMERAIRRVSVERGIDPRGFALLAFGGAGGMHACEIASSLEIDTVVIPEHAGVLSALGMLLADVRKDYLQTILRPTADLSYATVEAHLDPLEERARAELAEEGFVATDIVIQRSLDMRYRGQAYEVNVPFTCSYEEHFHQRHQLLYGYANRPRATEIVNVRVDAQGITRKYTFPNAKSRLCPLAPPSRVGHTRFRGRAWDTAFFRREDLSSGMSGVGPAIVSGGQATVVIPPGFRFQIDGVGTIVARRADMVCDPAEETLIP